MSNAVDLLQIELTPIIGQYCYLEPLILEKHAEELFRSFGSDEKVFVNNLYGPFLDQVSFNEWLSVPAIPQKQFVIYFKDSAHGIITIHNMDHVHAVAEIGVTYSQVLQNTRASTEIIYLVLTELFEKYAYRRVQWHCVCSNLKSINAAKRLWFVEEARCRNYYVYKERSYDGLYFSILDHEWLRIRDNFMIWLNPNNFDEFGRQKYKLNPDREKITEVHSLSNQVVLNWQNSTLPGSLQFNGSMSNLLKLDLEIHAHELFIFTELHHTMFTYTNFGPFRDEEELVSWFRRFHEIWHHYCLFDSESGTLLAVISLIVISPDSGIIELSFLMVPDELYEDERLQKIINLLLQELFGKLGYRRCQFQCNADNYKLFHYFNKIAAFEGILRGNFIIKGQSCDSALFCITIEDFSENMAANHN